MRDDHSAASAAGIRATPGVGAAIVDVGSEGLDLYNTMIEAHGISTKLGPSGRAFKRVDKVLT